MPRQKPADKIEALRRQQVEIAAKLKEAETKARKTKRDDDQHREQLVGRCVLAHLDQEPESKWSQTLMALLDRVITRRADRVLFPALSPNDDQTASHETK